MMAALKTGGYVVYLRHALTDTNKSDRDPIVASDCTTQRPLSDQGRVQARTIGKAFKAAGIRFDHVFTSPYCRAVETAGLAFPELHSNQLDILFYSLALPKEQAVKAADDLKGVLATTPANGMNTILISHTSNLKEAAGIWPKKEGGAIVFRPNGKGAFALIGSIDPAIFEKSGG
jgi:phosphohistidine phosphatase SixA